MSVPQARCYIHIGLPKTGTSYLQGVFWRSLSALKAQDVEMLPSRRADHFQTALQLRGLLRDFDLEEAHHALTRLADDTRRVTARTVLMSQEALAPSTPDQIAVLLDILDGYEVHVLVTARDLGRQVPSAWQQRIQARHAYTFSEFLDAVVDRAPLAEDFWVNQDLMDVLARWGTHVPAERIHLVTNPPSGSSTDLLLERVCGVLQIDASELTTEVPSSNISLGYAQAELLRRVNLALGDRFPHPRAGYGRLGKEYLANRVLRPQAGRRPIMPTRLRPWCESLSEEWIKALSEGGFDIVGDLDELRPRDSAFGARAEEISEQEVMDAAVAALATVLELRDVELEERARLRETVRRLRGRDGAGPHGPGGSPAPRSLPSRVLRRAGRLLRRSRGPR